MKVVFGDSSDSDLHAIKSTPLFIPLKVYTANTSESRWCQSRNCRTQTNPCVGSGRMNRIMDIL